jgi:hypothetical protein
LVAEEAAIAGFILYAFEKLPKRACAESAPTVGEKKRTLSDWEDTSRTGATTPELEAS